MAIEVYSVAKCIERFFNTLTTTTKAECDIKAASLVGEPVEPVPVQGLWSYTVTAGPDKAEIVQFRAGPSALDTATVNIAMFVHRRGATRDMSLEGKTAFETRQFRTVGDLAGFFAEAWKGPQHVSPTVASNLRHEIEMDLIRPSENLPDRFLRTLNLVLEGLPRSFTLPFVVTHGDLNETNILVDDDGYITAIVDWAGRQAGR